MNISGAVLGQFKVELDGVLQTPYWDGQSLEIRSDKETGLLKFTSNTGCVVTKVVDFPFKPISTIRLYSARICPTGSGSDKGEIWGAFNNSDVKNFNDYLFQWSNGQVGKGLIRIKGASFGQTYSVVVTDKRGCTTTQSIKNDKSTLNLIKEDIVDACNGLSNGRIHTAFEGNNDGYSYEWSNMSYNSSAINLMPGTYKVKMTYRDGEQLCSLDKEYTVGELKKGAALTLAGERPCPGSNNGALTLNFKPSGAILWDNGLSSPKIDKLSAGNYCVTVTDNRAECSIAPVCFTLMEKDITGCQDCGGKKYNELESKIRITNIVPCTGTTRGSINVITDKSNITFLLENKTNNKTTKGTLSLGSAGTSIDLSLVDNVGEQSNTYTIRFTEAGNSCFYHKEFVVKCCASVTNPPNPILSAEVRPTKGVFSTTSINTGAIFLEVNIPNPLVIWSGGPSGFTFKNPTSLNQSGLAKGTYTIKFLGGDCGNFTKTFRILDKDSDCGSVINTDKKTITTQCPYYNCGGGSISYSLKPVQDFYYQWSTGERGAERDNLRYGTYAVVIKHLPTGCSLVDNPDVKVYSDGFEKTGICDYKIKPCGKCTEALEVKRSVIAVQPISPEKSAQCIFNVQCEDLSELFPNTQLYSKRTPCAKDPECKALHPTWHCAEVKFCVDGKKMPFFKILPTTFNPITPRDNLSTCAKEWVCSGEVVESRFYGETVNAAKSNDCYTSISCELNPSAESRRLYHRYIYILEPGSDGNYVASIYATCEGCSSQNKIFMESINITVEEVHFGFASSIIADWADARNYVKKPILDCSVRPFAPDIASSRVEQRHDVINEILNANIYPNPFNDFINIELELRAKGNVEIKMFDAYGRLLLNNGNNEYAEGVNLITLNPETAVSGIYFIEIKTQNATTLRYKVLNIK